MKTHKKKYLKDYTPPAYLVQHIELRFDLYEEETRVISTMTMSRNRKAADETTPLVLNAEELVIEQVVADGMVLLPGQYKMDNGLFELARTPDHFTLEITTLLKPQENKALEGLYRSGGTFCTQCEAQGFRKITCFPDRPDVMTEFSCIITADKKKYPVLLSNGNPVAKGDLENGRHWIKWHDPFKKPCYLFALVAGELACIQDSFTTVSGRDVQLKIYVEHENRDKCGHAMKSLKQSMAWDEQRFGREYDLDLYQIVAVNDFNMGAMENKGLNVFNSKYVLADSKTATDTDFMNIQGVIGHEYFHNWSGNRVTLRDWFQLSLKEGLTVFRDQEFTSDLNSRAVKRISDVKKLRAHQFPEDSGPMAHPVRPESYIEMNNFYTMTVYDKGAELIRMMYILMGKELFRRGMDLYFDKFDGQAVTTEDFVRTMEEASGLNLGLFRLWYSQSGTPMVTMERAYDEKRDTLNITLTQETLPDKNQTKKLPLHIPVLFGLLDGEGNDITPEGRELLELKDHQKTFTFTNVPKGALPSIFRQFSAPVKIKTDYSNGELAFLMAHDKDEFNRWDAGQELFFREMEAMVAADHQGRTRALSPHLIEACRLTLLDGETSPALLSKSLTIPDEVEIGERFSEIDVDAVHRCRKLMKKRLAKTLKDDLLTVLKQCNNASSSDISSRAMAERSMKNLILSYLGELNMDEYNQKIRKNILESGNMTDEIAGLAIFAGLDSPLRSSLLEHFYNKWKTHPLVIDKWFAVQAASTLPNALKEIKALAGHPDFSLKNPNRARSLIGVVVFQNPVIFHTADGSGYKFLTENILKLNKFNPQIAARFASGFNHWRRYDPGRQKLMKAELGTISQIKDLSKDVYEIVSRALE